MANPTEEALLRTEAFRALEATALARGYGRGAFTPVDALEACPAFEAVDCRYKDLGATMAKSPYDFYADHIAAGAMVFGEFRQDWQRAIETPP